MKICVKRCEHMGKDKREGLCKNKWEDMFKDKCKDMNIDKCEDMASSFYKDNPHKGYRRSSLSMFYYFSLIEHEEKTEMFIIQP